MNDYYEVAAADPLDSGARDLPSSSRGPSLVVAAVVRRFGRIIIIVGAQLPFPNCTVASFPASS